MTGAKKGIPARDVGAYLSSVLHDKRMILEGRRTERRRGHQLSDTNLQISWATGPLHGTQGLLQFHCGKQSGCGRIQNCAG